MAGRRGTAEVGKEKTVTKQWNSVWWDIAEKLLQHGCIIQFWLACTLWWKYKMYKLDIAWCMVGININASFPQLLINQWIHTSLSHIFKTGYESVPMHIHHWFLEELEKFRFIKILVQVDRVTDIRWLKITKFKLYHTQTWWIYVNIFKAVQRNVEGVFCIWEKHVVPIVSATDKISALCIYR